MVASGATRFPRAASEGDLTVIAWQEFNRLTDETGEVRLSLMAKRGEREWMINRNFAGPYLFAGKEAPLFSLTVDESGRIIIAVSSSEKEISIISSDDDGKSFTSLSSITSPVALVAPRIYRKDDGGNILFVTKEWTSREGGDALSIFYSLSENGNRWTDLEPLVTDPDKNLNFLPHHTSAFGNEYVVFQALETEQGASYQLYLKKSEDGGQSWSEDIWLSGFEEYMVDGESSPYLFNNQRPFIKNIGDQLGLTWERSYRRENPQIYYATLDEDGNYVTEPDRVTGGGRYCNYPQIVYLRDYVYLLWFDDRAGEEHVILADKSGVFWEERDLSRMPGISLFPRPVISGGELYIAWENRIGERSRLIFLKPDQTVRPPVPQPLDFAAGQRYSRNEYSIGWNLPRDSSGIAGFSYSWDRDPEGSPPERLMVLQNVRRQNFTADEDGEWYFHVKAQDYAGNWSKTATISVVRDTTPPGTVEFVPPPRDDEGYLRSNTFTFNWKPPEESEQIGGYSYSLQYLGSLEAEFTRDETLLQTPPASVLVNQPQYSFRNRDNGYWALTVRAIDTVGNAGEPETIFFKMDKYIPVTYITDVSAPSDDLGRISMQIRGRGFAVGGLIESVILDRDGERPFDYIFPRDLGLFKVVSDRLIVGPEFEDVDEGVYRVGVIHPERGLYFTRPFLKLESSGAVKFGDFRTRIGYEWRKLKEAPLSISVNDLVLWIVLSFLAAVVLFSALKVGQLAREGLAMKMEAEVLIGKREIPMRKKRERLEMMRKRGMGLRIKFTLFITAIIIAVVLGVSLYLGNFMIKTQRENLAEGLRQQTEVLLESLAAGARENLPRKDVLGLDAVLSQRTAMEDAVYATITGQGEVDAERFDYIWATDDPNITEKIEEGEELTLGRSRIQDSVSGEADQLANLINERARENVAQMNEELDRLGEQAVELARRDDEESARLLQEYQQEITALENRVNQELLKIGDVVSSVPAFREEQLDPNQTRYIFYKPVVYARRGEQVYFRGMVRVGVSTERILAEIEESRQDLIITTGIIAAIAIGVGIIGAILFATIMIIPITRLVHGVEKIRDTEDKEALRDHSIQVRSRDEISALADTVNQMTQGLVKAAAANKDLIVGKEVQKMFIPLEKDRTGKKLTTGKEENDNASFFGYYEGAKGVSGDYFDFRKLDDKHYAVIKCDVAGKGVPASLIMVEVATIFLNYFRNWSLAKEGINLEQLVYNMNDLLEERGFKGRFAALIVVIINVETGACYFCNAGDNIVHMYDNGSKEMMQKVLPESPAAGVFPSMLVEMQSGFTQIQHSLKQGDTLFLFTDGIEEAQRKFRDSSFNLTVCNEESVGEGETHGNHVKGSEFEELGIPRIYEFINAVFNKRVYRLTKYHDPAEGGELVFDFTTCGDSVEEAVLAMVSVEKVFRIYPDPQAGPDDRVTVDRKIDEFLKKHFRQYHDLFGNPVASDEADEYVYFSHLKEDEQFDDLTILGIKKL